MKIRQLLLFVFFLYILTLQLKLRFSPLLSEIYVPSYRFWKNLTLFWWWLSRRRGMWGGAQKDMWLKSVFSLVKIKNILKNAKNSTKSPPPAWFFSFTLTFHYNDNSWQLFVTKSIAQNKAWPEPIHWDQAKV